MSVRPKKSLGQHFLTDHNIARKIVDALPGETANILEIGPGTGILTRYLLDLPDRSPVFIETDTEAVEFLLDEFPSIHGKITHADFLKVDLDELIKGQYQLVGNLPYNISSQIFFRVLEDRDRITSAVVMIQKEVADRISSGPGNKVYGILSVLLQTWYDIEYLFTVPPGVFNPPPKVKSAVIRLKRNEVADIGCDPAYYFRLVKTAFNQRRKTLRNALKPMLGDVSTDKLGDVLSKRAEQLSVRDFRELCAIMKGGV
ncbi:MAG TPA: 16S rRNA (adenine(1518)-N(6)/adenine(1519)-N(6))-dimethyltransferase RsmA [Bacteroidales bacterium]|nr:16S rRNA (adenine(1518)-N(6)/adenine(1519)-N(6))-dimethyltransferase RsmA [Bacteroidales bacterium]